MNVLTNILAFLVALGVIIFVHEMGHLLVAKAFAMKVPVFSIGFGRALWKFRRGDTEYRVAWLPLGGYVRLGGDDPEELTDDPRDFLNRPRWQRVLVYLAGPVANGVLAVVLMAGVFMVGIEVPYLRDLPPVVGEVAEASPAAAAGLEPGDRIVAIDGEAVERWDAVGFAVMASPAKTMSLTVERDGSRFATELTPESVPRYEVGDAGFAPRIQPRITQLVPGLPGERAGLRVGDELHAMDGRPVFDLQGFVQHIQEHAAVGVELELERDGRPLTLTVVPVDEGGSGRIGAGIGYFQRFGPIEATVESVRHNAQIVRHTLAALGHVVTGRMKARSALSGPIGIAAISGEAARAGVRNLVYVMALLSISIGLLNLFPIPILDGGQIALLLVEGTLRRDLSLRVKERVQQLGFALIIALMAMVIYFDLVKALPSGVLPGS
ncbi:MAG: RIP metalloprotease RseP [Thermoanaerobaculia bacterium]